MRLDAKKFGLACGLLWGAAMFILTLISIWTGYANDFLGLISSIYPGYDVSYTGSLIGIIEGFIDGFIGSWLFATIYNRFVG